MSIQEISGKFKALFLDAELFMATLLVLVAVVSFGLGRLSITSDTEEIAPDRAQGAILMQVAEEDQEEQEEVVLDELIVATTTEQGSYVASKNGTKYHLPWCPGAQQMNEENKVWFDTKEEAEAAGYTPAANCPGL